ncbi:TfuA-like protein [Streptomyces sp. NPDC002785]|uniref:TfuA-like protein n=1 Tax=Streptomyces sp. NPDC002785 TaxID=3154543 RepID=UPI00331F45AF
MAVHVFVGPSCPEPLVRKYHPDFVLHAPVRHGDLFSQALAAGDVAVIVDGVYHHSLALRHKEILDALERRITILGAASIGALRAAELDELGMIGVGRVYDWYRDGVFDGDDAVSVAHSETSSPVGINIPLVNLHAAVLAAADAGVLTREAGRRLLARLEREYYPLRTVGRILALANECGESAFADWYAGHVATDPAAFDQKRADALQAFALAELLDSPPRVTPVPTMKMVRDWRTEFHRRWRNRFAPVDPLMQPRIAYQQIFAADFPDVWWGFLHRSSDPAFASSSDGFPAHVLRHLGPTAARWLDDPALRSRITTLLCPLPDLADSREAELLLRRESAQDRARVTDWMRRTQHHLDTHPARSLAQITDATCARLLARIWDVHTDKELAVECGRRGFPSLRQAAVALRPFAIGYLGSLQQARTGRGGEARG